MKLWDFNLKEVNFKNEILAGLTVAIALVPEAIAFSFIAGVPPLVGLYAAFIMGLVTAVLGGRPGMISGATGAIAVVIAGLYQDYGPEYLYATILLGGFIQMVVGFLKLGKFIRLVPHSVMLGFVNGLAIVIFTAQFPMLGSKVMENGHEVFSYYQGEKMYIMLALIAVTMLIIIFLPKLTKVIPAALAAILVVAGVSIGFHLDTPTVHTLLEGKSMKGGFPPIFTSYSSDFFSLKTLKIIGLPALSVAGVGLIESLLTLTLIDEKTNTRGSGNRESVAQGLANVISGIFGSMGGCAMIGQSMINIESGARKRLSGIVAALTLLAFVMFLSSIIEQIPVAALVGVMFMVSYGTFEWSSLKDFFRAPKADSIIMVIVSLVTIFLHNLALAVLIGVILAALSFAWDNALRIRARKRVAEDGIKYYEIWGPLFFGSTKTFLDKFTVNEDPDNIVIDFEESRIVDQSGLEAIRKINDQYVEAGKNVKFRHLSDDCKDLLNTAKVKIELDPVNDPKYKIVYNA